MIKQVNVAISGGPGTGKSVLAAALFAEVKICGLDYDLIEEERRRLKEEMGDYRSPFERLYMWRQQEREEVRSSATDGFITDTPLFHLYIQARWYAEEPRDMLAVRELFRMCTELWTAKRYQIIAVPRNPDEVPYRTDQVRTTDEPTARKKHASIRSFVEHFWPDELLLIEAPVRDRVAQIVSRIRELQADEPVK